MSANEVHVDDIGTDFPVTIMDDASIINISSATLKQIIFTKPSGTKVTKTGAFVDGGVNGVMKYTTVSGDLDERGEWKIQAKITLAGVGQGPWNTDIRTFRVYGNL